MNGDAQEITGRESVHGVEVAAVQTDCALRFGSLMHNLRCAESCLK